MSSTRAASMPLSSKLTMPRAPIRFMPLAIRKLPPLCLVPMVPFRFTLAAITPLPLKPRLPRVPFRFTGAASKQVPTTLGMPHPPTFKRAAKVSVTPRTRLAARPLSRMATRSMPPIVEVPCAYFTGDANGSVPSIRALRPLSFHSRARDRVPPIHVLPCAYFKAGPQQHCHPLRPCPAPISKHGQCRSAPQRSNAMPIFSNPGHRVRANQWNGAGTYFKRTAIPQVDTHRRDAVRPFNARPVQHCHPPAPCLALTGNHP